VGGGGYSSKYTYLVVVFSQLAMKIKPANNPMINNPLTRTSCYKVLKVSIKYHSISMPNRPNN
jgi:hypothetical protein